MASKKSSSDPSKNNLEDFKIEQKVKILLNLPMPDKADWKPKINETKTWTSFLPKRELKEEEIADLRYSAKSAPGITATKVIKLIEKHPTNYHLYMLVAICCLGILDKEKNKGKLISSLKTATQQALVPFHNDSISIYNSENFLNIYYLFLETLKEEQLRVHFIVNHDPNRTKLAQGLLHYSRITNLLLSSQKKNLATIKEIKAIFKKNRNSNISSVISKKNIRDACALVNQHKQNKDCAFASAGEIMNVTLKLMSIFGRIPILEEAFLTIYNEIPEKKLAFRLRKESARSNLLMSKFKIAMVEGNTVKIKKYINDIYTVNFELVQKLRRQTLTNSYEIDPFMNIAMIAGISKNYLKSKKYIDILSKAKECMEYVMIKDVTKGNKFSVLASKHSLKLNSLLNNI